MKPRKPIRKVSTRQAQRLKEYAKVSKQFLDESPNLFCPVMLKLFATAIKPTEVHHLRGRVGALLCDTRYLLAVSPKGHRWIHANIEEARWNGWICAKGDWNRQPKD